MFICFDLIWAMAGLDQLSHFIETSWVSQVFYKACKSHSSTSSANHMTAIPTRVTVVLLRRNVIIAYP